MNTLKIIYSASETDNDLYYATGFLAPDPFLFIQLDSKKVIFLSDLEYERGKSEAKVDLIVRSARLVEELKKKNKKPTVLNILLSWLEDEGLNIDSLKVEVPNYFPAYLYRELSFVFKDIEVKQDALFAEQRMKKTEEEKNYLREILKITAGAFDIVKKILEESKIDGEFLYYDGEKLTSEFIKQRLNEYFAKNDAFAMSIIIASGEQGCEPHNCGSGPIYAHKTLIADIYPRSLRTRYFGDMTRTFVKGTPPSSVIKLYETVKTAQEMGISMVKAGVDSNLIHSAIVKFFEESGYKTGLLDGKLQGFIHSTGHGIGLDIHEPPRIVHPDGAILEENYVVTVEPGLYYYDIGAVRIEDVVMVKKDGAEILSDYPKILQIP
jgi:Xaa-Pro aminopeptidase